MIERLIWGQMAEWPEGISDGLNLSCYDCGQKVTFDFTVDDEFWREVVPQQQRRNVSCLPCLDSRADELGLDIGPAIRRVQFTGIGVTVVLTPDSIHRMKGSRLDAVE